MAASPQPKASSASGSKMKLINATIALLASKGYESSGINEILDTAKVAKSNFYYHFKSKEELCLAALDKISNIFFTTVLNQTLGNQKLPPIKRLERHFDYLLEVMETKSCDGGCVFTNLEAETSDFYPSFREKLQEIDVQTVTAIEQTLADGAALGDFRKDLDVKGIALLVMSLYKGIAVMAKTRKDTNIIRQSRDALFGLLKA